VRFSGFERNLDGESTFNSITGSTKQFGERMDRLPKTVSSQIIIAHTHHEHLHSPPPEGLLSISFLIAQYLFGIEAVWMGGETLAANL
jgi:hypothetical protein